MAEQAVRRFEGKDVSVIEDAPPSAIVRLRGANETMLAALGGALGVSWSDTPNVCARGVNLELCWLGPGEWAVIGGQAEALRGAVEAHCDGATRHVAEMTDAWARWRLRGAGAAELLARGCSLDLHPSVFATSQCARTLLGQVNVLLVRRVDSWDLFAERALCVHLWKWFERAGRTFELREIGTS